MGSNAGVVVVVEEEGEKWERRRGRVGGNLKFLGFCP